ncbi:MAG: hypothetical protein O3C40_32930 [Planctomycetota bacterium]|nr:hypothetical protein [Planctomycetota bacterium]
MFIAALAVCTVVPYCMHRWMWRQRRLEQLARLLSRKLPRVGDQLLGVIELVSDASEQARSPELCEAAMNQVATDAKTRDFRHATPDSRHRMWSLLAGTLLVGVVALFVLFPAAATNAWARFATPWQDTPRYTFAAVATLPPQMVVPHGEPFTVTIRLNEDSRWRPTAGQVQLGLQQPVHASLSSAGYAFEMPPQIDSGSLQVRIGDFKQVVKIEPTLRPELASVVASVLLPEYLGRPEPQEKDVRGGAISLVKGSTATFSATANRKLTAAKIDGQPTVPSEATLTSAATDISESRTMEFQWEDEFGLAGKEPFSLTVSAVDDEAPTLMCEDLPRRKIILDSEQLRFGVKANDDFGIKRIGMQWSGFEGAIVEKPAQGERMLVAGDYDQVDMSVAGTFTASSLGIEPQPIQLRIFAEDYFPGRERIYSPTYVLYVLSPEQHAIWMTEQLSKWHRQALEVRDRELTLYETNKQLRALTPEELDHPDTRERIEKQASAERANGNNLSRLTMSGEDLVKNASRNPEFGVGHLEKWAEMLQILKDISANRMPTVSDLLKQASEAERTASAPQGEQPPTVGQVRATGSGPSPEDEGDKKDEKKPAVPQIVDLESSQQPKDDKQGDAPPPSDSKGAPRLTLPVTTLLGGGPQAPQACAVAEKVEEAVTQQEDLLAEFEKVANELNSILANLEGSTLVKRLKAESRNQYKVAGRITDHLDGSFGVSNAPAKSDSSKTFDELAKQETNSSYTVSLIMDDMSAYFERRRFMRFKTVLEDMKGQDVVGGLRLLGDDIPKEQGLSIAQCEFWSDSLDRWAEDLVDPAKGGS